MSKFTDDLREWMKDPEFAHDFEQMLREIKEMAYVCPHLLKHDTHFHQTALDNDVEYDVYDCYGPCETWTK